jgi:membrane protein implicated in regulation of membrane protease activity
VVELGVVIAAIGLALAIIGMLVPTAPPQLASLGWVLLAIGLVLIVVAVLLDVSDAHDHARHVFKVARSSWGELA